MLPYKEPFLCLPTEWIGNGVENDSWRIDKKAVEKCQVIKFININRLELFAKGLCHAVSKNGLVQQPTRKIISCFSKKKKNGRCFAF